VKPEQWKQYSDVELVIAALVGNLQAFDELALRFRPAMLTVAYQIVGTYEAAEDVVQDALLLAFKALPQLDDVNRFAPWLYAITRHRAFRYLKEEGRHEPRSDLDEVILKHSRAIAPDVAQTFTTREIHRELCEAIKGLGQEHQVVLQLYYWDEMSQQQIADFLDLPLTTVKWRLYKAKQMLKAHLENLEGERLS